MADRTGRSRVSIVSLVDERMGMSKSDLEQLAAGELVQLIESDDTELGWLAMEELMGRQQSGKDVRIYNRPRLSVHDEGVCPLVVCVDEDELPVIRLGRSNCDLGFDSKMCGYIASSLVAVHSSAVGLFTQSGLSIEEANRKLDSAQGHVSVTTSVDKKTENLIVCSLRPIADRFVLTRALTTELTGQLMRWADKLSWASDELGLSQSERKQIESFLRS